MEKVINYTAKCKEIYILHKKKSQISKKNAEEAIKDVGFTLLGEIKRTKGCLSASIIFSRN